MDPVGPWYTSYNRLPPSTGTFPGGSTPDFLPHQPPTTSTPLILQSHPPSTLAGQPTFNPSGFLTPPSVSYDVFSPLFHPSNPKQPHYAHRQMLPQPGGKATTPEPEATIRDYNGPQTNFFENQAGSGLAWSHQNNQLPSPFGILPHESVTSSPGPGVVKSTSYENNFNTPFNPAAPLNSLNPIQSDAFKSTNFESKKAREPSPSSKPGVNQVASSSGATVATPFFQQIPTTFGNDDTGLGNPGGIGTPGNYQPVAPTTKVQSSLHTQQSCIVSAQTTPSGKDYRLQGGLRTPTTIFQGASAQEKPRVFGSSPGKTGNGSVPTKAQSKVYPDMMTSELRRDPIMESSQSSPISFSMIDTRGMNYNTTTTPTSAPKLQSQRTPPNPGIQHQQFHVLNQQTPGQTPYRHYPGSQVESEYHHPRSKSAASTDSAYSSNTSQNGPDCGVVVPRRPSPLQAHSQASPLGHVPSPAYPMYNSPMASMSSPSPLQHDTGNQCSSASYKGNQQQVTPPAPLDVTVPRPASQGQVGYPSVITRALAPGENNNFTDNRYDRQEFGQKQICWDNNDRQRKFTGYSGEINPVGQGQRSGTYFEGGAPNHVPLQDLSSCRDPMNAKSLAPGSCQVSQTLQQSPDVQKEVEDRRKIDPSKKRRSFDKTQPSLNELPPAPMTDYLNRVPPPAHHNSNQQNQNGYYDFERWNLPPNAPKVFAGSSGAFAGQPGLHSGNFTGGHQQGIVGHHSAAAMPYFPGFHLPSGAHGTHHPEFQSGVDMPSIPFENSNSTHSSGYQDYREDQPKVIVPNIEEELGFLQQNEIAQQQANQLSRELKANSKDPNSGFMTSYLKFLQGEREPSPPPAMRGGRKATWSRSRPYVPPELNRSCEANGQMDPKMQNSGKEPATIDYANDPRYFPLPKERKKPYIDSSDDGIESEDDFPFKLKIEKRKGNGPVENSLVKTELPRPKKGRPIKPGGPTDRKRKAAALAAAQAAADAAAGKPPKEVKEHKEPKKEPLPPRRETSKRKAKDQVSSKQLQEHSDGDEQGDSDSDPAWTPAAKLGPGDEDKKKKRGRPVISKRAKNLLDADDYSSVEVVGKRGRKKNESKNSTAKVSCKIDEKLLASVTDEDIDISPFKSGEFVVMKAELNEEYPALWRIDGKTLLQKYEPFASNGKTLYRNISTYSGWAPQNRHIYQQVPVKFWQHSKMETIVEFLRDEMLLDDSEYVERRVKEYEKYQDHFEVYIQTLISQALDSNFLTEIFQEQDDYFLSNVKTVDDMTEERKRLLLSTTKWGETVISAISTWPCLNILKDIPSAEYRGKQCNGCQLSKVFARVLLYGQPYNATTLEGSPPDLKVPQEKDFLLCRVCQTKVGLFNKVAHQKYLMFLECARRVADKRLADQNKDTTIILNELLADEVWLNQLFKEVRTIWAEIDNIEHQVRIKENAKTNRQREIDCETNCNDVPSGTDAKTLIEGLTKDSLMTDSGVSVS